MIVQSEKRFEKNFKNRIAFSKHLVSQFSKRLKLFTINRSDPALKDHQLTGTKKEYRAFSVTGDIRVIYQKISDDHIVLVDIGSHNQVY